MLRAIKKIRSGIGNEKNKGFIIDLRNNPGGLLSQAIGVSDSFLEGGEIVSTRGRNNDISRFNARKGDITYDKPIIILISTLTLSCVNNSLFLSKVSKTTPCHVKGFEDSLFL